MHLTQLVIDFTQDKFCKMNKVLKIAIQRLMLSLENLIFFSQVVVSNLRNLKKVK